MTGPAPLTPPDSDLRDFAFMPLDVARLLDSNAAALANAEAFRACVIAWCVAWHQVPAGSLPDDDAALSVLLGYGRTAATWKKVRKAGGLHGWHLCSDGRLYHATVAEKVNEAWGRKQAQRERGRKGNQARWGNRKEVAGSAAASNGDPSAILEGSPEHPSAIPEAILGDRKVQGQGQGQVQEEPPVVPPSAADAPPLASPPRSTDQKGNRLPPDWQPDQVEAAFARQLKLDPAATADRFRDYWHAQPGAKGRKANWSGTWRNWCRKDADDPRRSAPVTPRRPGHSYAGCL